MHVPAEANIGPGESVAIIGAALRFPGASDPSSFHEMTVAGRRMFRELAHRTDNGGLPGHGAEVARPARRRSRLPAPLDDPPPPAEPDAPPPDGPRASPRCSTTPPRGLTGTTH